MSGSTNTTPTPKVPQFSTPVDPNITGAPGPMAPSPNTNPGSYTPDWTKLIEGDAGLKAAQALAAGNAAADKNALNNEFATAYESFGKPIDLSTLAQQLAMSQADIQSAIGPEAQRLAQEHTDEGTSTVARLDQANKLATQSILANLNKRGILNSGETGYRLDQQNLGYRQAQQDAYTKFLGYLQQYQQGYLSAQQKRSESLITALNSAADRQYNLNQGTGATTSTSPSGSPPASTTTAPNTGGESSGAAAPIGHSSPGLYPVPSLARQQRGRRGSFQPLY